MTTTPDPVSAHDLAEALREAHAVIVLARIPDGITVVAEQLHEVDVRGAKDRWKALLDRYDAQVREGTYERP